VFVVVDDLRWDESGRAGHPFVETPQIDRLAREGSRFLNAFATTPLCSPSRASLLTGQYAHTHGILDNTARPSHGLATFRVTCSATATGPGSSANGTWATTTASTRVRSLGGHAGQGEALDPSSTWTAGACATKGT